MKNVPCALFNYGLSWNCTSLNLLGEPLLHIVKDLSSVLTKLYFIFLCSLKNTIDIKSLFLPPFATVTLTIALTLQILILWFLKRNWTTITGSSEIAILKINFILCILTKLKKNKFIWSSKSSIKTYLKIFLKMWWSHQLTPERYTFITIHICSL